MHHQIDRILYLNLAHRQDRKERIESELAKLEIPPSKITRIEGYHDPLNGHRGCAISHIKALEYAIKYNLDNVLILEDDFVFTHSKEGVYEYLERFFSHFSHEWDVFLLSSNVLDYAPTNHPHIKRVLCAQTTHSYLVNRHYISMVLDCFKYALSLMQEDVFHVDTTQNFHSIDHVWKLLQPHGRWYIGSQTIGKQGASFSDICQDHIKRFTPNRYE